MARILLYVCNDAKIACNVEIVSRGHFVIHHNTLDA